MSDKLFSGVKAGSTSISLPVLLTKTSDGTEMTGKVYSDATCSYWRQGGSRTAITPVTQTVAGAWTSGGFVEVDATNQPGIYRFDVPDAAFATGADWVIISVKVASAFVYNERINLSTDVIATGDSYPIVSHASYGNAQLVRSTTPANSLDVSSTGEAGLDFNNIKDATGTHTLTNIRVPSVTLTDTATTLTNAPADSSGVTTLLSRLTAARAGYLDVLNGIVAAIWAAVVDSSGVTTLLGRLTSTRAGLLDNLDAAVSTRSTYAGADTAGTTTLLARLTSTRAGLIDNLDAAISTRLAAASYVAPDNADIATLIARVTSSRAALLDNLSNLDAAVSSRSTYAGGAVASVTAAVTVGTNNDKTGYGLSAASIQAIWDALTSALSTAGSIGKLLVDNINATISSRLATSGYTAPDNTNIAAGAASAATAATQATTAATQATAANTATGTILSRIGAFTGSGVNTILGFLKAALSKTATLPSDVGGTFDPATDSQEAIRDRGDAAWGAAGSDPWNTPLPGSYAAGTAGYELAAVNAKVATIGNGTISIVSPVDADGNAEVVRGADYYAADGRSLDWDGDTWPNLTGASIAFVVEGGVLTVAGTVVTAGSGTQQVRVQLSAAQTALLVGESYRFNVVATLAGSGHIDPIVPDSTLTVKDRF